MKITNLKMNNFAKFTDFEIEFDGKITHLVGINGSGKTTVGLTAIWACLKGIAEKGGKGQLIGEKYRFIGDNKKTADIELTLFDEAFNAEIKIRNHISKDACKITFNAPTGYKIDGDWVNNLFSVAFLSAKNFISYSSKDQALLLGIDTSAFDEHLEDLKKDYTFINRKLRGFGEITAVAKAEKVSIGALLAEKEKIDNFNNEQVEIKRLYDDELEAIEQHYEKTETLRELIQECTDEIKEREKLTASLQNTSFARVIQDQKDTTEILDKINNAEEINQQASEYQAYIAKKTEYDVIKEELNSNDRNKEKVKKERLDYIKAFNFGFKELSVNEKGELLLLGKPIKEPYFSRGELEIIVTRLYMVKNPELKLRFIDDFELLDEANQKKIIEKLLEKGFQIITAQVGDDITTKENAVLLRECKKVGVTE